VAVGLVPGGGATQRKIATAHRAGTRLGGAPGLQ
jgi:hypothetical protein